MQELIAEFNDTVARRGSEVRVSVGDGEIRYHIAKLAERVLVTSTYDIILQLAKRMPLTVTVIDLSACRVVSSLELTLIGYIVTQTRFHGGQVRIAGASAVNQRALNMVGFDRLVEVAP